MHKRIIQTIMLVTITGLPSLSLQATWFESSGQAVIMNGNKTAARQEATEEAIRQALMFAGASVTSVQTLANGLLENESFEVRASGEVNSIELIDEIYQGDVLTVSIRADVFAQKMQCRAADYKKSIATAWFPIAHRHQAAVGNLYDFGEILTQRFQKTFTHIAKGSYIKDVQPFYVNANHPVQGILALAQKTNAQYVVLGAINEFTVNATTPSRLAFWKDTTYSRDFSLDIVVYDGNTGTEVFTKQYPTQATWDFDIHANIDANSNRFWQSRFGQAVNDLLDNVSQELDNELSCMAAYGRVLYVDNDKLNINLGRQNGLQEGDKLTLFQKNQFYDPNGNLHQQFQLSSSRVKVSQVFANTAVVVSATDVPLMNIQANDFVARR